MAKFGQRPKQPIAAPKDPSAMSVLGMVPPERPPAPAPTRQPSAGSTSSSLLPSSGTSSGNKVKNPGWATWHELELIRCQPINKTIPQAPRKKAKPSLFMPKKR